MKDTLLLKVSTKKESPVYFQGIFKAHFPKETMLLWLSILPFSSSFVTYQSSFNHI